MPFHDAPLLCPVLSTGILVTCYASVFHILCCIFQQGILIVIEKDCGVTVSTSPAAFNICLMYMLLYTSYMWPEWVGSLSFITRCSLSNEVELGKEIWAVRCRFSWKVAVEIMCLCVAGTEPESTVITQSSIPQLASQPAPSIMRKRGYEHINGVEGEHCNYSCLALQSVESLSTQGCVLHVAARFSSIVEICLGSWYHCLPIRTCLWLWEEGCTAVVWEAACCMEVRPGL